MAAALFYLFYFAAFGIYVPYWTLYLRHLHFTSIQIATLSAIPSFARIVFPLLFGYAADRLHSRKSILILTSGLQLVPLAFLLQIRNYQAFLVITAIYSIFNGVVLPIVEATVQEEHEKGTLDYGRTRLWGTLSFIVLALIFGQILDRKEEIWILYGFLLGLSLTFCITFVMPAGKSVRTFPHLELRRTLKARHTRMFFTCVFLMYASHGAFYGFYSIHLADLGFKDSGIGLQWAVAAFSEFGIFFFASRILAKFPHRVIFSFCLLAASLRWFLTGSTTSFAWLTAFQALHAFSFGAFHITSIRLVHKFFPEGLRSIGQSIYTTASAGFGMVVGLLGSGWIWDSWKANAFYASSGLALAAFLVSLKMKVETVRVEAEADRPPVYPGPPGTPTEL